MYVCKGLGERRGADAGVVSCGLSQFKLWIAGLKLVTVEEPRWPLTKWTLSSVQSLPHLPHGKCVQRFGAHERA